MYFVSAGAWQESVFLSLLSLCLDQNKINQQLIPWKELQQIQISEIYTELN